MIGNLTWNANGTLQTLAITDPLNSANSQTCSYGYDDLVRISSAGCGATWSQTFSFDPFGNISKSGTGTFQPTYNTMNRYQTLPGFTPSYDANGNLLNDSFHQYTWDQNFGNVLSIDTVGLTYDALGRMVEQNRSGSYTQIVYSPTGEKLALMNGQTLQKAFVALPTGATAVYTASGLAYYRHADWLGSSRLATTPTRTKYYDVAYAPYGENYSGSGTTDLSFTGQNQDTVTGLHDFMFREYHPASGRWISPDPAGLAAAEMTNPQSWNRYAYVSNEPSNVVDPFGLYIGMPPSFPSWWSFVWQGAPVSVGLDQLFCMVVGGCQPPTQQTNSGGNSGGTSKPPPKPKAANNGTKAKCISRSSLPWDVRAELKVLGWMAQRSGGVRGIGVGASGAFSPPSLAGGGGSVQALWVADYLGQQGLYYSVSGGPTVGQAGAGGIVGVQYMTSTSNRGVTVQDVVNSSLAAGGAVGAGFAVGADVNLQTGVFTETVGFGGGGFGGAPASLNIASGFIPICRE